MIKEEQPNAKSFSSGVGTRSQYGAKWRHSYPLLETNSERTNAAFAMVEERLLELEARVVKLEASRSKPKTTKK